MFAAELKIGCCTDAEEHEVIRALLPPSQTEEHPQHPHPLITRSCKEELLKTAVPFADESSGLSAEEGVFGRLFGSVQLDGSEVAVKRESGPSAGGAQQLQLTLSGLEPFSRERAVAGAERDFISRSSDSLFISSSKRHRVFDPDLLVRPTSCFV